MSKVATIAWTCSETAGSLESSSPIPIYDTLFADFVLRLRALDASVGLDTFRFQLIEMGPPNKYTYEWRTNSGVVFTQILTFTGPTAYKQSFTLAAPGLTDPEFGLNQPCRQAVVNMKISYGLTNINVDFI